MNIKRFIHQKCIIKTIAVVGMLFMIFQMSGCGVNAGKSKIRIQKILRAMDQYYNLKVSFRGATIEKLESLDLLQNFSRTNIGGGQTELIINSLGTGYTIKEPNLGNKTADKLVEIFKKNAKTGKDGKPMAYNSGGDFSLSIGT